MQDYTQYLPPMLLALGGLLQWMRAQKNIKDQTTLTLGALLAVLAWLICSDFSLAYHNPQLYVIHAVLGCSGAIGTVFGGTFMAAKAANAAVDAGANPDHFLIPGTNSK